MLNIRLKAELALLFSTILWGSSFVVIKIALQYASPVLFLSSRFFITVLLLSLIYFSTIRKASKEAWIAGGILGLFLFLGFFLQTLGLNYTTASKSAFITGLSVVIVPILSTFLAKERPRFSSLVAVVLVIVGLWLLTSPLGGNFNRGDLLTLFCTIFFALQIVYLNIYTQKIDYRPLFFIQMLAIFVFSLPGLTFLAPLKLQINTTFLTTLILIVFFCTYLSFFIQSRFQRYTTPTRAVLIYSVEPVIASVLASLILDERLTSVAWAGAALILAGMLLSELGKK